MREAFLVHHQKFDAAERRPAGNDRPAGMVGGPSRLAFHVATNGATMIQKHEKLHPTRKQPEQPEQLAPSIVDRFTGGKRMGSQVQDYTQSRPWFRKEREGPLDA